MTYSSFNLIGIRGKNWNETAVSIFQLLSLKFDKLVLKGSKEPDQFKKRKYFFSILSKSSYSFFKYEIMNLMAFQSSLNKYVFIH